MKVRRAMIAAAVGASILAGAAHAGIGDELRQLTASDGGAGAPFGNSVDLSAAVAIISGLGDDSFGEDSGAAYLIDVNTGAELRKLTAADAAAGDVFGQSVAISGNVAVVGANLNDDHGNGSGSAYVFDVSTGQQRYKLTAPDASGADQFGGSVDVSGNVAIVGAFGNNAKGFNTGSAYLYNMATAQHLFLLNANDANVDDWFGWSVGISGNIAIVGARYDDEAASNAGAAYLFDVTTGQQLFKLMADDAAADDDFGWSVAISGNTAIVGAHLDDDNGNISGSAYLFDVTTGNQLRKLTASDGAEEDEFGRSVAIFGQTAIVGASNDEVDELAAGSAYLFDVATGNELAKLTADNATNSSFFGYTVAIDGEIALVGAPYNQSRGRAYLFSTVPEPASAALLGWVVACSACVRGRARFRKSQV